MNIFYKASTFSKLKNVIICQSSFPFRNYIFIAWAPIQLIQYGIYRYGQLMQIMHLIMLIWNRRKHDGFIKIGKIASTHCVHASNVFSFFRSFAAQCQIKHNRQHTALHICNALDKYILVSFGEKSCWYGRIGPCNQDQAWKNKTATDPIN